MAPVAAGRGAPPVPPMGVKAKVPLCPALSVHVPPSVAVLIATATCTGRASGEATMPNPISMVPSGFGTADPVTGARVAAPHWSS